jgi:hypothetical protein
VPVPKITWRREDGRVIFRDPEKRSQVGLAALFHGEHLELQVSDTDNPLTYSIVHIIIGPAPLNFSWLNGVANFFIRESAAEAFS